MKSSVAQKLVAQSREPSPHPLHYQVRRISFQLHIRWIQPKTLSTPKTIDHHSGTVETPFGRGGSRTTR
eukprot:g19625.t1